MTEYIPSIRCTTSNGGCGNDGSWRVTIDDKGERIIIDCTNCRYRESLPLGEFNESDWKFQRKRLEEKGEKVVR